MTETIEWVPVAERLPDVDETVLIVIPEFTEPVWTGWLDADGWLTSEGLPCAVTHWATMPKGPQS